MTVGAAFRLGFRVAFRMAFRMELRMERQEGVIRESMNIPHGESPFHSPLPLTGGGAGQFAERLEAAA